MGLPPLILASASPRRARLLRELNLPFRVIPALVEEIQPAHFSPAEICQINAYRKSRAIAKQHPDSLVIGADTVVCLDGELLGKPADLEHANKMLQQLQGRTHQVITGVCLVHLRRHRHRTFVDMTQVTFHRLTPNQIARYLESIQPLDKAGAYAIQEQGDQIVEKTSGSYSNVVGLPLERLRAELENWEGVSGSDQAPAK